MMSSRQPLRITKFKCQFLVTFWKRKSKSLLVKKKVFSIYNRIYDYFFEYDNPDNFDEYFFEK